MKKTRTHREIYNKTREVITNKSILTSFFTSTLKFSLALAIFFIIALLVYAGDVIVQNGKLDVDGKLFVDDAGNVGIGTTNPLQHLHINDDSAQAIEIISGDGGAILELQDTTATANQKNYQIRSDDNLFKLTLLNDARDAFIYDNILTSRTGRIGIGTASPLNLLHVGDGTDAGVQSYEGIVVNVNGRAQVSVLNSDADVEIGMFAHNTIGYLGTWTNNELRLRTNNDDVMTLLTNGNVGIGITNPGNPFHLEKSLSGNAVAKLYNTNAAGYGTIIATNSETTDRYILSVRSGGDASGDTKFIVRSDGNVGIGTTSPDHDLEIGTGTYSEIDAGEAQFTTSSSRTYKENIKPVSAENILNKISEIPVNTFDFKEEFCDSEGSDNNSDAKCKNKIGLIAEDFHQIFERGDEKKLSGQEVQMALWLAVQELKSEKDTEIEQLRREKDSEIQQLTQRIQALEAK